MHDSFILLKKTLSHLDNTSCILEPNPPSFAVTNRRIAIEKTCSVMINIDPKYPKKVNLNLYI